MFIKAARTAGNLYKVEHKTYTVDHLLRIQKECQDNADILQGTICLPPDLAKRVSDDIGHSVNSIRECVRAWGGVARFIRYVPMIHSYLFTYYS
jgi:hypothetical protein